MTVIDSLVVLLGLDAEDLKKRSPEAVKKLNDLEKQGDKTEKSVGKISKTSKETARGIESLTRVVTTLFATIGGAIAIKGFIQDFIDTNAQLDRLSRNLNLSVADISAWSNATEKLGGSAQGLQGTLDMLSKSQTQLMLTGESSLIPYMSALGISLANTAGKARPVTDILLDLSDRFSRMDRTTANNLGRMMGLDQGTMNLLLQGRKELELEIARQKEHNAVTKEQAEAAAKLQQRLVDVKQGFQAFGRSLLMDAVPSLEKLLNLFQNFATWAQEHQQFIADFLKVMAIGLGAIALVTLPIDLTIAAVLALAAAIALLWEDYQTWKKGGDSFIDWGKWEPGIKAAIKFIGELKDTIERLLSLFNNKGWDNLKQIFANVFSGKFWQNGTPANIAHATYAQDFGAGMAAIGEALGIRGRNAGPVGKPTAQRSATAKQIQDYFEKQGWTPAQAAGIAANLIGESGGNAGAVGDKGLAYGVAQWHSDRQAKFRALTGRGIQGSSLEDQLAFVQFELTRGDERQAGDALKSALTARDAGAIVSRQYERPKDADLRALQRGDYAESLMRQNAGSYAQGVAGIPGASQAAAAAPTGLGSAPTTVDKSVQTTIGEVNIKTAATDAEGMAHDARQAFDWLFSSQANWGLN